MLAEGGCWCSQITCVSDSYCGNTVASCCSRLLLPTASVISICLLPLLLVAYCYSLRPPGFAPCRYSSLLAPAAEIHLHHCMMLLISALYFLPAIDS